MRILVVGDPRSIHTARFVALLQELGHVVHVFAVELQYDQEEHLRDVTLHVPLAYAAGINGNRVLGRAPWLEPVFRARLLRRFLTRALFAAESPGKVRCAARLCQTIGQAAPDLVFSLKMQNEGYAMAAAHAAMGGRLPVPWIHFSWGTDIEFFGKHPGFREKHLPLIRDLLGRCGFHVADTQRDLDQAPALGFAGRSLGTMPATGGFDLRYLRELRDGLQGTRDTILVKGRQGGYVGKALNVLEAIRRHPDTYRGWRVRFFMASEAVASGAQALHAEHGIDSAALPRLSHRELLEWYGRAAIAVSASDVDGTPGFLLEAMAMGAFPVHSDMASIREWIDDGENGLLFPVDDIDRLDACMGAALSGTELRECAAVRNFGIIEQRADREKLKRRTAELIDVALGSAA